MKVCPKCGSNVLIHYDFTRGRVFCLDCESISDEE